MFLHHANFTMVVKTVCLRSTCLFVLRFYTLYSSSEDCKYLNTGIEFVCWNLCSWFWIGLSYEQLSSKYKILELDINPSVGFIEVHGLFLINNRWDDLVTSAPYKWNVTALCHNSTLSAKTRIIQLWHWQKLQTGVQQNWVFCIDQGRQQIEEW